MKKMIAFLLTLLIFVNFNGIVWAIDNKNVVDIESGTIIPVSFTTTINSDRFYNGDVVPITITEDVFINNKKVFSKGSLGTAEIFKLVRSGSHGRAGLIEIREVSIKDVNGQRHQAQLSAYAKGESRRASAIALSVLGVCLILVPFGIWREGDPAYLSGNKIYNAILIN